MSQYWLYPHVHLCIADDQVVLLDLQRDKYLGIGQKQINALAAVIKGWPTSAATTETANADKLLSQMLANGMLTTDPALGKEAKPLRMLEPAAILTEEELEARPSPTLGQIVRFLKAAILIRLRLRWRPLISTVDRARLRKEKKAKAPLDIHAARKHVEAFLYLRPLLFGARDECLYDSCALIEFLASYGIYPNWIFAVQARPFLAHSWVQHDDIVFNDTPAYVGRFTPIMSV